MERFEKMRTAELAHDTLRRSRDVHDVVDRVFYRLGVLLLGLVAAVLPWIAGLPTRLAVFVSFAVFFPPLVYYLVELGECAHYTNEMNARTDELKKRNSGSV